MLARGDWDRGRILFEGTCSGCHGREAEGGIGPQLANPTFLDTVTDAMLRQWSSNGKLGTAMQAFRRGRQGVVDMTSSQIEHVITLLRYNRQRLQTAVARPGMGIIPYGEETYAENCVGCHGAYGEGLVGPALSNLNFLQAASDGYLAATIILGRENTPMAAMGHGQQGIVELDAEAVANLVAFIRSWQYRPQPSRPAAAALVAADRRVGEVLYTGNCVGCHGQQGNDGWAPALNNPEFLAAATDGFLKATVARGRRGTAMRPFGKGSDGMAQLTGDEIEQIVTYLRSWTRK